MLKLYLVRHGESAWNVKQLYTGRTDVPLSDLGERQAERLSERLGPWAIAAIYASPLKRAADTARPTAARKKMTLRLDARLKEIHHGAWEGNPANVIREQYADEYLIWRTQPHRLKMPDGESLDDVSVRVASFLQDVLAEHADGNVVVVSHDAVLRVIVMQTLRMGLEHFWRWRFDNAALSMLERLQDGHFRLALLNDARHLDDVFVNCDSQAL